MFPLLVRVVAKDNRNKIKYDIILKKRMKCVTIFDKHTFDGSLGSE